jgi:hypothetical protein
MTIDDTINHKKLIREIKRNYSAVPDISKKIDLDSFQILTKGYRFRKNYIWQINADGFIQYLISLHNSYRGQFFNGGYMENTDVVLNYLLYCYCEFDCDIPDFVIRPNRLEDKIADRFSKAKDSFYRKELFDRKYRIEYSKESDVSFVEELNLFFDKSTYFTMEIKDRKCLLMNMDDADYKNTDKMIRIIFELLKINRT